MHVRHGRMCANVVYTGGRRTTWPMKSTQWILDPTHSEIQFKVRHLMITNVTGSFSKFNADVETADENFDTAKISFTAEVDSITTNNEQRDGHLKSADFFESVRE